jgi:hypothetical protein
VETLSDYFRRLELQLDPASFQKSDTRHSKYERNPSIPNRASGIDQGQAMNLTLNHCYDGAVFTAR